MHIQSIRTMEARKPAEGAIPHWSCMVVIITTKSAWVIAVPSCKYAAFALDCYTMDSADQVEIQTYASRDVQSQFTVATDHLPITQPS